MCGIGGIVTQGAPAPLEKLHIMLAALRHRGPDGEGIWAQGRVGLIHTRLAIIDPVPSSNQPMTTPDGRFAISFNGEIYNYRDLRQELESQGARFRTNSDTEVFLQGFVIWGTEVFRRLEGMFAAALWDGDRLFLVRDRLGMKPLYHCHLQNCLLFASEPKALLSAGMPARLRPQGLLEYFLLNNPQANGSMFQDIHQVPPGSWAEAGTNGLEEPHIYWRLPGGPRPRRLHWPSVLEKVGEEFSASVRRHLVSDVELGIYLSGGIDSSLIAAAAAKNGAKLHGFSISFPEIQDRSYIEFIRRLSSRFGIDYHPAELRAAEVPELLSQMNQLADEPIGDAADLGIYALSRSARKHVKVVLTGDGGDEVFGGYSRHRAEYYLTRLGGLLRLLFLAKPFLGPVNRRRVELLTERSPARRYAAYLIHLSRPERDLPSFIHPDLLGQVDFEPIVKNVARWLEAEDRLSAILRTDLATILHDTYLRKIDRASMMAGIEGRVPFLDRSLLELSFHLPPGALLHPWKGKLVSRRLLDRWIPDAMAQAPKMGFTIPVRAWLATPGLRTLRESLAAPGSPLEGIVTRKALEIFAADPADDQQAVTQWKLLRLALWKRNWLDRSPPTLWESMDEYSVKPLDHAQANL